MLHETISNKNGRDRDGTTMTQCARAEGRMLTLSHTGQDLSYPRNKVRNSDRFGEYAIELFGVVRDVARQQDDPDFWVISPRAPRKFQTIDGTWHANVGNQ